MSEYQIAKDLFELLERIAQIECRLMSACDVSTSLAQGDALADRMSFQEAEVDPFIASILRAQVGTRSESKSWPCAPEPWVFATTTGIETWRISNLIFSIVRATNANGTRICTASLSGFLTSCGYRIASLGQPIRMILKNVSGGAVYPEILLVPNLGASCSDRNRPVAYTCSVNPDVFDVTNSCSYYIESMSVHKC